jgi:predicted RNase H-like HicB family nuclease
MNEQHLINAVRNHALANYNVEGWDYLVECWMDGDILECLDGAETVEQAITNVREALAPLAEMRDEVRSAGEW